MGLVHPGGRCPTVTFSVNGLSAHDETLFKSYVRLLAHRTLQQWTFAPQSADVCVVTQVTAHPAPAGKKELVVGQCHAGETYFVSMPFHADALELVLNDLGNIVAGEKQAALHAAATDMPHAHFRLLRWPAAGLLTSNERMRLATMMTGKWTSLAALHEQSGLPVEVCSQFMTELLQAGLLANFAQVQHAATTTAQPQAGTNNNPPSPRNIEPGLISRIRSRLGIFASGRT